MIMADDTFDMVKNWLWDIPVVGGTDLRATLQGYVLRDKAFLTKTLRGNFESLQLAQVVAQLKKPGLIEELTYDMGNRYRNVSIQCGNLEAKQVDEER